MRPPSLQALTLGAVAVLAAVLAFLWFGEYTRRATVAGLLAPDRGVLRLVPSQAGTLVESHAVEGRAVRRGDVLFVLDVGQSSDQGDTQGAVAEALVQRQRSLRDAARQQQVLTDTQTAGLQRQREDLQRELAQIDAEEALQQQRLALAEQAVARLEALRAQQFISDAQVQARTEELLGVRAALQALGRQRVERQRQASELAARLGELPLQGRQRQAELERDLAELRQAEAENASRRRLVVRAPEDGVLGAVTVQPGQAVTPAIAMASLVPAEARLQAQLYAPSSAVGFIRPEQPVRLRYQAFPYQKFGHHGGHVVQVSRTPLQPAELAGLPLRLTGIGTFTTTNEPLYRITVALDAQAVTAYGQPQALAPGMQLDADVLLDRRRLIEWIFEPLISVAGRL